MCLKLDHWRYNLLNVFKVGPYGGYNLLNVFKVGPLEVQSS